MLILTRKVGQSFCVGDDVIVTIVDAAGDKVRVGIDAPREVRILREELRRTMDENQLAAQGVDSGALRSVAASLRAHGVAPKQP